jgi:hypothetical protein
MRTLGRLVVRQALFAGMLTAAVGCGSGSPLSRDGGGAGGRGSGTGGQGGLAGTGDAGADRLAGSPGSVTLRLVIPGDHPFCDRCAGMSHFTIFDSVGEILVTNIPSCSATCSPCAPTVCPPIACIPQGLPVNNDFTWDGTSTTTSTCGNKMACFQPGFAPAGHFMTRMCATPGVLTTADGGSPSTCTATGLIECVDVSFDLPGPSPVVGTLP